MDFMELAQSRYSVRKFSPEKIDDADLRKILDAGHIAPTAANKQPQKVLVVNSEEALAKLRLCTGSHYNCPLALIVGYDKNLSWKRPFDGQDSGYVDASIVITHMMLEAQQLGIGSTWVMFYDPAKLQEQFDVPENIEVVSILVMGKPADDAAPSPKHTDYRDKSEIECYNQF